MDSSTLYKTHLQLLANHPQLMVPEINSILNLPLILLYILQINSTVLGEIDNNDENGDEDDPMLLGGNDSDDSDQPNETSTTPAVQSTKLPIKPRPKSLKKRLQEEEFNVMKGLASSIAKERKKEKCEGGECETYGKFLIESLKKFDESTRHLVQYRINNILFQAQMGMLTPGQCSISTARQQDQYSLQQPFTQQQQQQQQHGYFHFVNNQGV